MRNLEIEIYSIIIDHNTKHGKNAPYKVAELTDRILAAIEEFTNEDEYIEIDNSAQIISLTKRINRIENLIL
jgi:hypothetical protein